MYVEFADMQPAQDPSSLWYQPSMNLPLTSFQTHSVGS